MKRSAIFVMTALAVCAVCPVIEPCRDHARRFREAGIWGGENEAQRRAALRVEKPAAGDIA